MRNRSDGEGSEDFGTRQNPSHGHRQAPHPIPSPQHVESDTEIRDIGRRKVARELFLKTCILHPSTDCRAVRANVQRAASLQMARAGSPRALPGPELDPAGVNTAPSPITTHNDGASQSTKAEESFASSPTRPLGPSTGSETERMGAQGHDRVNKSST